MFQLTKFVITTAVVALLSGCATGILRVDQERYQDGVSLQFLQGNSILGPPDGDRFGLVAPPAFITDNTPGNMGRAVRVADRIEFITDPDHNTPDRYQVVFSAARLSEGQAITNIILRDNAGNEALRLRYQLNEIGVIWGDDAGLAPATYSGTPHEIKIVLHMNGVTAAGDVTITQGNNILLDRKNLALIDRDFDRLEMLEVRTQTDFNIKDLIVITQQD